MTLGDPMLEDLARENPWPDSLPLPPLEPTASFESIEVRRSEATIPPQRSQGPNAAPPLGRGLLVAAAGFSLVVLILGAAILVTRAEKVAEPAAGPFAVAFHVVEIKGGDGTFAAAGPAVDAGLVCPAGTTQTTFEEDLEKGTETRAWVVWEKRFVCAGSAQRFTLVIEDDASFYAGAWAHHGTWTLVDDLGEGGKLTGFGTENGSCVDAVWCATEYSGRLRRSAR